MITIVANRVSPFCAFVLNKPSMDYDHGRLTHRYCLQTYHLVRHVQKLMGLVITTSEHLTLSLSMDWIVLEKCQPV